MIDALAGLSTIAPNTAALPHALKYRGADLWGQIIMFGLFAVGGAMAGSFTLGHDRDPILVGFGVAGLVVVGLCAWRLWLLRSPAVILNADSLEKRTLLGWRRIQRSDIKGVGRTKTSRNGSYFFIYPKPGQGDPIFFTGWMRDDPIFAAWLAGAPDPEAQAIAADLAAVLADPRYGATETDRAARLALAKQVTLGFGVGCAGVAGWLGFFGPLNPVTVGVAFLAIGLGFAMVQLSGRLVVWNSVWKARPTAIAALLPLAALAARAAFTTSMLQYSPLVITSAVLATGVLVCVLAWRSQMTARLATALGGALLAALMSYWLGVLADVAFDTSTPRIFPAQVTHKHVSRGRSTSYYLSLGAWNGNPPDDASVSEDFYEHVPVGGYVCAERHGGAVALPWFDLELCPAGTALPASSDSLADRLARYYPDRAQRNEVEGSATIECQVSDSLVLGQCRPVMETPTGYGFGEAAVRMVQSGQIKFNPKPGEKTFRTTIRFRLGD